MEGRAIEESSFEELLKGLEPRFRAVLARFRIPEQDAEDLLQQALLAYVRKRDTVHNPESWLVGTLRNRCLKYWRARRRSLYTAVDSAILETVASDAPSQERSAMRRDLLGAMGRLRPRCRSILGLRYGLGCEPRETARRLGYKESSIYKLVERCLAALSSQLLETSRSRVC
ncbi:MAG: RNA polymerase sigma factor [Thermoanaerobaculia bacterium]